MLFFPRVGSANFEDENTIAIDGNQKYIPKDVTVEGDYSASAFLDALGLIGGDVTVLGLSGNSMQGDRVYKTLYKKIKDGTPDIDISDCPDLGPILFTLAAYFGGARFTGCRRLRIKESDRVSTMVNELRKFGADIIINDEEIIINKTELKAPVEILYGHNDHRVVMSLAVLLTKFGGEIMGAEAVKKSYPDFFKDIASLGIEVKSDEKAYKGQ